MVSQITTDADLAAASELQVDALIRGPQNALMQAEKNAILTPISGALCRELAERSPLRLSDAQARRVVRSIAEFQEKS